MTDNALATVDTGGANLPAEVDLLDAALNEAESAEAIIQVKNAAEALKVLASIKRWHRGEVRLSAIKMRAERKLGKFNPPEVGGRGKKANAELTDDERAQIKAGRVSNGKLTDREHADLIKDHIERGEVISRAAVKRAADAKAGKVKPAKPAKPNGVIEATARDVTPVDPKREEVRLLRDEIRDALGPAFEAMEQRHMRGEPIADQIEAFLAYCRGAAVNRGFIDAEPVKTESEPESPAETESEPVKPEESAQERRNRIRREKRAAARAARDAEQDAAADDGDTGDQDQDTGDSGGPTLTPDAEDCFAAGDALYAAAHKSLGVEGCTQTQIGAAE